MKVDRKKLVLPLTIALLFLAATAIIRTGGLRRSVPASAAETRPAMLVIDPGHGGLDGGASAADGTTESGINLAIALRLRDLCLLYGLPCKMTRTSEALEYPPELGTIHEKKVWDQQQRLAMTQETRNSVLLSIHQNYYPDRRPSGIQVLYAETAGSEQLGTVIHDNLLRSLCPECRRVLMPAGKSIYLMKQVQCPAILVECGFLSNPEEAAQLASCAHQTKIAAVLLASYLEFESMLTAA